MIRWLAILLLLPASLLGQGGNASSATFRRRAEADARKQLAEAIRSENWALVKETAEELDELRRVDKAHEKPEATTGFQKLKTAGFSLSRTPDEEKKAPVLASHTTFEARATQFSTRISI